MKLTSGEAFVLARALQDARVDIEIVISPTEPFMVKGPHDHDYQVNRIVLDGNSIRFTGYKYTHTGTRKGMPQVFKPADRRDGDELRALMYEAADRFPGEVATLFRSVAESVI